MILGCRVIRGPGWLESNPDVDEGLVGTIVRHSSALSDTVNIAEVLWDDGSSAQCNISKTDKPELLQLDSGPAGIYHKGTKCSFCKETPIAGLRWQCILDDYINMCTVCYMTGRHEQSHPFRCIDEPGAEGREVKPRDESDSVIAHGLFLEATVTGGRDWDEKEPNTGREGKIIEVFSWEEGVTSRSGVKVLWPSKAKCNYKVGHNGIVQLKCAPDTSKTWGRCFRDHLPPVRRIPEQSMQRAKQFKKGDFVKVSDSYGAGQQQTSFGPVSGRSGVIITSNSEGTATVYIGDRLFQIRSEDLDVNDQKNCKNELPTSLAISDKIGSAQAFPTGPYQRQQQVVCTNRYCPVHSPFAQMQRSAHQAGVFRSPAPHPPYLLPSEVPDKFFWGLAKLIKSDHLEELAAYLNVNAAKVSAIREAAPGNVPLQFVKVFQTFRNGLRQDQDCLELLKDALKNAGLHYLLPQEEHYNDYGIDNQQGLPSPPVFLPMHSVDAYQGQQATQHSEARIAEDVEDVTNSYNDSHERSFDDSYDIPQCTQLDQSEPATDKAEDNTICENEGEDDQQESPIVSDPADEEVGKENLSSSDPSGQLQPIHSLSFKKGDIVRVKSMPIEDMKRLQRGHGGWTAAIGWTRNSLGKVLKVDSDGDVWVTTFNGPRFAYNPECLQLAEKSEIKEEPDEGVFKKGQGVKVRDDITEQDMRRLQEEFGGWVPAMTKLIGQPCVVTKVTLSQVVVKMYDGEKWALNFLLLEPYDEAATDMPHIRSFKQGERVKVKEMAIELMRQKQEGYGGFVPFMEKTMGSIGIVQHVFMGRIVRIKIEGDGTTWAFNQSCLQHEDPLPGEMPEPEEVDYDDQIEDDVQEDVASQLEMLLTRHKPDLSRLASDLRENDMSLVDGGPQVLIDACRKGEHENAAKIIRKRPEWANYMTEDGQTTPLIMACQEGYPRLVRFLLDEGACIDLENGIGITPLIMAAYEDKREIVQELLKREAKINAVTTKGQTAIHFAIARGNEDCVHVLLDPSYGADVNNLRDENDMSAAELVLYKDEPSICALMLTSELCDPTVGDKGGFNLLHTAAKKGNYQAMDLILSRNPDMINAQKTDGWTALHLATWNNHIEVVRMLLNKENCNISVKDNDGDTCFHLAVVKRNTTMIQLLVDSEVDLNAQNYKGVTALHVVLAYKTAKDISALGHDMDIHKKLMALLSENDIGSTTEHMSLAMYLVQNGAHLDIVDNMGNTPIGLVKDEILKHSLIQAAYSRAVERANLGIEVYHPFVTCDACFTVPLRGTRYKCSECDNFDLCQKCKEDGRHADHEFIEILQPVRQNRSYTAGQSGSAPDNRYFPKRDYISFDDSASETTVIDNLRNTNKSLPTNTRCKESELANLSMLLAEVAVNASTAHVNPTQIDLIRRVIFEWPMDNLMPVLDILRLAVRCRKVNEHLFARNAGAGNALISRLLQISSKSPSIPIQATVCRVLTNAFLHPDGKDALTNADQVSVILATISDFENIKQGEMPEKQACTLRIAVASLLLNLAVTINSKGISGDDRCSCVNVVADLLGKTNDFRSNFRLLVAMGTLICGDDTALATAKSLGLFAVVNSFCLERDSARVHLCACAKHLLSMLE